MSDIFEDTTYRQDIFLFLDMMKCLSKVAGLKAKVESSWLYNMLLSSTQYTILCTGADIMYLTVSSWFLICFVMGGSGLSRAIKFLNAPALPPPHSMGPEPPSWALVHKTSYAPMIYTSLWVMIFDARRSITWARGRGLSPLNLEFFGP